MRTHIAKSIEDFQNIRELAEGETWKHARRFLERAPQNPFADHLRWLEDDGRPVACVQVFVHQYPIGRAQVGMCLPEYPFVPPELRGRGYFKKIMADLFGWMPESGYPLAYDHGVKGLYTSALGYAPGFHHCIVLIRVGDVLKLNAEGDADTPSEADLKAHESLFRRPFPLGRGMQCRDERWRPELDCVRVVRGCADREIRAFVVLGEAFAGRRPNSSAYGGFKPPEGDHVVTITDAWASDLAAAALLLRHVAEEAETLSYGWIRLNCRRDDPLARIAVLAGGELRWCAAQERDHTEKGEDVDSFCLVDLPLAVRQLLPELSERWRSSTGCAPEAILLRTDAGEVVLGLGRELTLLDSAPAGTPQVYLPRKAMTQAIIGYAAPTELCFLHAGCEIHESCCAAVDVLFEAREPHLIHEGYAFAGPNEFGLVP